MPHEVATFPIDAENDLTLHFMNGEITVQVTHCPSGEGWGVSSRNLKALEAIASAATAALEYAKKNWQPMPVRRPIGTYMSRHRPVQKRKKRTVRVFECIGCRSRYDVEPVPKGEITPHCPKCNSTEFRIRRVED